MSVNASAAQLIGLLDQRLDSWDGISCVASRMLLLMLDGDMTYGTINTVLHSPWSFAGSRRGRVPATADDSQTQCPIHS